MERLKEKFDFPFAGELTTRGYFGKIVDFTLEKQLLDADTWKLLVNQFRLHPDDADMGWRGEYWGKMMRGASLTYRATKNEKLYAVLRDTVEDLLTTQEPSGRISTYPLECEFDGWDMWCRKYMMLGLTYFLEICKSAALKRKIVSSLKKQANYILSHVGKGRGKKSIFETSPFYGAMNSCSILEPFVKLYALTGEQKYFDFATYIVASGFCSDMNLIEACLSKASYPYQFTHTKAYEMMSCFEGLLEYYKFTKDESHLRAVVNFVDLILETDFTLVGGTGCRGEFLNNSTRTQTVYTEEEMQETCVSVTFSKLCAKLLEVTGEEKYVAAIERIAYNIMPGAVNTEDQKMIRTPGLLRGEPIEHDPFPFDSYSPIYQGRRGLYVAGFKIMQEGRSYGCCVCISSAGTALSALAGVMKSKEGVYVNMYSQSRFSTTVGGEKASVEIFANVYEKGGAKIRVKGVGQSFALYLRIASWMKDVAFFVNGEAIVPSIEKGYAKIEKAWENDLIQLKFSLPVVERVQDGKCAFTRGPVTLCRDERFGEIQSPVALAVKDGKTVRAKIVKNDVFNSNLAVKIPTRKGEITLCDYAQAGKNYDDEHCNITVWQDVE